MIEDLERVTDIVIDRLEIVIDDEAQDKVELYIVNAQGERLEGGTFDRSAFMTHVLQFYQDNY